MSKLEANSKKRIGLGRGLGALLDDSNQVQGLHASDFAGSMDTVNLMEEISLDFNVLINFNSQSCFIYTCKYC